LPLVAEDLFDVGRELELSPQKIDDDADECGDDVEWDKRPPHAAVADEVACVESMVLT
jgi:hypothetical protein